MAKVKTVMTGTHAAGAAISRCIVMAFGNQAVKSNNPILVRENWGTLQLNEDWTIGVSKPMKDATGKIELSQ